MTAPRTAAGRALLAESSGNFVGPDERGLFLEDVLAIEAEAAAQERERLLVAFDQWMVPTFHALGDPDGDEGVMRRCLTCGRTSKIVALGAFVDVQHEEDCAYANSILDAEPEAQP